MAKTFEHLEQCGLRSQPLADHDYGCLQEQSVALRTSITNNSHQTCYLGSVLSLQNKNLTLRRSETYAQILLTRDDDCVRFFRGT